MSAGGPRPLRDEEEAPAGAGTSDGFGPSVPLALLPILDRPLVSVLVTNKDYARFLPEALGSLIDQSYDRWEAIVCDDGSSDGSAEVLRQSMRWDARVTVISHAESRGQAAAFNTAFQRSSGKIVCFLDADDTFAPDKLERIVDGFRREPRHEGTGAAGGLVIHPLMMFDDAGLIQRIPALSAMEEGWIATTVLRRGGRWRWVPTSGIALRREVADLVLPMPEEAFRISADTYLLVLAALLTEVVVVDRVLGGYRRHGANRFAQGRLDAAKARRAAENLRVVVDEVNERLSELGRSPELRIDQNLKYGELMFQAALLEGAIPRRDLARRCREMLRALRTDDLYRFVQKAWAMVLYPIAILLPVRARARWLSWSLAGSRAKERIRRLVGARTVRRTP